jgi:ppGpp synthetase/RelA/SpoT-type nucleotidyltranferase
MPSEEGMHISHAETAAKQFQECRHTYERFAETLKLLLATCLAKLPIHVIEGRAKSTASFLKKSAKSERSNPALPRYSEPLLQITDLAGVRIITYFPDAIGLVEEVIKKELVIIERTDKSKSFEASGKLGYQSVHYLIKLGDERLHLPEYAPFAGLVAEVQVRTILQHAWAEMEHDIQYKSEDQIPTEIRRRFASLAGLIEIADREFQAIQDSDAELRKQIRASLAMPPIQGAKAQPETTIGNGSTDRDYERELAKYNVMVDQEPNQFAHYLGRAKLRFLLGDRTGALDDLARAEVIAPGHDHIASARFKIDQGLVAPPLINEAARKLLAAGLSKLSAGDGVQALADFDAASSLSSDVAFVNLDRSLALCLLGRLDDASVELNSITPHPGSFVKADVAACNCMIKSWRDGVPARMEELDKVLLELAGKFNLAFSVLRHLQSGLTAIAPDRYAVVQHVFERLTPGQKKAETGME